MSDGADTMARFRICIVSFTNYNLFYVAESVITIPDTSQTFRTSARPDRGQRRECPLTWPTRVSSSCIPSRNLSILSVPPAVHPCFLQIIGDHVKISKSMHLRQYKCQMGTPILLEKDKSRRRQSGDWEVPVKWECISLIRYQTELSLHFNFQACERVRQSIIPAELI